MDEHQAKTGTGTERGVIEFLAATENLRWDAESFDASLRTLFKAVNQLAIVDFEYYQRRAKIQSRISYWLRVFGSFFGTLGVVSPALIATEVPCVQAIAKWGYCFFALSGSLFAINSLFGGTSGHARYVAAQLKLEEVIVRYGVKWSQYSAGADGAAITQTAPASAQADTESQSSGAAAATQPGDKQSASTGNSKATRGFELISEFLKEYTTVTSKETLQWAEDVVNDAKNYASNNEKLAKAK